MIEALKKALLENEEKFRQEIKSSNVNFNEVDEQGNTLLHFAADKGFLNSVKFLLAQGADLAVQNKDGNSALHLAVQQGFINIAEEMLGISDTAKIRKKKAERTDKDRSTKLAVLEASQKKAVHLLIVPNNKGEIPLILAAGLQDDSLYKTLLLKFQPGYAKNHIDAALNLRQKHIGSLKNKSFWSALFETFCPSASIPELTESIAYTGLFAGASAAVALGINIAFAVVSILGFTLIMFANYKKNQSEKNAVFELEELQAELAFLQSIRKRMKQLSSQAKLSPQEKNELHLMQEELKKSFQKPVFIKGNEKSAADYITGKEKMLVALSSAGSFLCSYSGALGLIGLGLAVTAGIMGTSLTALIISAGPIGIGVAMGVGLLLAGALAFYHYNVRKQNYMIFGESRLSINNLKYRIYNTQKDLLYARDKIPNQIDRLSQGLPDKEHAVEADVIPETSSPTLADRYNHGHKPGEMCSQEKKQLSSNGFMGQSHSVADTPTRIDWNLNDSQQHTFN